MKQTFLQTLSAEERNQLLMASSKRAASCHAPSTTAAHAPFRAAQLPAGPGSDGLGFPEDVAGRCAGTVCFSGFSGLVQQQDVSKRVDRYLLPCLSCRVHISNLEGENDCLRALVDQQQASVDALQQHANELVGRAHALTQALEASQADSRANMELAARAQQLQQELAEAGGQLEGTVAAVGALEDENARLRKAVASERSTRKEMEGQHASLKLRVAELEHSLVGHVLRLDTDDWSPRDAVRRKQVRAVEACVEPHGRAGQGVAAPDSDVAVDKRANLKVRLPPPLPTNTAGFQSLRRCNGRRFHVRLACCSHPSPLP